MDKIQELTAKIYAEGVEKGKEEADKILSQAKAQEKKIISEAQSQADSIIANAKKEAADLKTNTESELKLYASKAVDALKSEVTNLLTDKLATSNVKAATQDPAFMQKLIVSLVENWAKNETLTIRAEDAEKVRDYFQANAKQLLNDKLEIKSVNGIKTAFSVSPGDESYKVNFGEEEFIAYFKEFLRPQIQKLLF